MSSKNQHIPAIRFKGFTDGWEQRKLKELTEVITKGTTPKDKSGKGSINFVKVENINKSSGEIDIKSKITENEHEGYLKRSQLKDGDILFSIAGTLGRTAIVKKELLPANTNQALAIIRLDEGDKNYITTFLNGRAAEDFIKKNPTVGAQPNLSLEQVGNLLIEIPSLEEQTKIGSFFKQLDDTIALHQLQLNRYKELKQAMLENMFTQDGEKIPKIRFNGFTEEWEQRKFKDFTKLSQGLQIAISERFLEPGENRESYITNEFLNPSLSKKYYIENPPKNVIADVDDILMTRTGNTGKVVTNIIGAFHNNFFKIDYDKEKNSKLYLYYLLTSSPLQRELLVRAGTSTIPDLNHNDFYKIKVYIPSTEEQKKIGNFFKQLDDTIALHQQKVNYYKQLKKVVLHHMFI